MLLCIGRMFRITAASAIKALTTNAQATSIYQLQLLVTRVLYFATGLPVQLRLISARFMTVNERLGKLKQFANIQLQVTECADCAVHVAFGY